MLISSDSAVTLLGAGPVSLRFLKEILELAPFVVAADGAAATALELGQLPDAVIGDFDSLKRETRARIPAERLHHVVEQTSTDFEKCLSRISAPLILALGFTGRRLDHELAVYNALVCHPRKPCVVLGEHDLVFHAPPKLSLDVKPGTRVSLFPFAPVTGRGTGLVWPIDGLQFAPDGRIGTSNAAKGPVTLEFDGPGMLVIMPREELPTVRAALAPG